MTANRDDELGRLKAAAARVAGSYGLEIFDVQFRRESSGWVLRVVIDRPPVASAGGQAGLAESAREEPVGIQDCQRISHDLGTLLDVEDELTTKLDRQYTLEVSSPGLDRPLRGEADYRRFRGRLAKLVTSESVAGQTSFAGRLAGVEDGAVLLDEGRRTHRVPLGLIRRARLEVEF